MPSEEWVDYKGRIPTHQAVRQVCVTFHANSTKIRIGRDEVEGALIHRDGLLIAVLSRGSASDPGGNDGMWHVEVYFPEAGRNFRDFVSLNEAIKTLAAADQTVENAVPIFTATVVDQESLTALPQAE